jgi:hypothetical protein
MCALMLMSCAACSVSVVPALQATSALTWMSPASLPAGAVASVTLVLPRLVASVLAPMPEAVAEPLPALTVKSVGSMVQWPCLPAPPRVSTRVSASTATRAAEVSTRPPRPPADVADSVPPTSTLPACMPPCSTTRPASALLLLSALRLPLLAAWSPVIQISPWRSCRVWARMTPLLLTSEAAMSCADCALSLTTPPSATMLPLLATLPAAPGETTAEISPPPLMLTVAALPEASTTEPASTVMSPSLLTCGPNSAR